MKFNCPHCSTGYDLPSSTLPKPKSGDDAPKTMRCVRCQTVFVLSIALASSDVSTNEEESVYFEMISPDELPQLKFAAEAFMEGKGVQPSHIRYEVSSMDDTDYNAQVSKVVSTPGAWDDNATLDLGDFEINQFRRAARNKAMFFGIIVFGAIGLFLYVAAMNSWSIRMDDPIADFKRAFGMESEAERTKSVVERLEVRHHNVQRLKLKMGKKVGVVEGEVQNNAMETLENVMLEGRLFDKKGEIVSTEKVPCGVLIKDGKLKNIKKKKLATLYEKDGAIFNCSIKSGFSAKFKVVFSELPKDVDDSYTFKVFPLSANIITQ